MLKLEVSIVRVSIEWDIYQGAVLQMDGYLPDGSPLRVMKSADGLHVSVGVHGVVPVAVPAEFLTLEILRQWLAVYDV